MSYSKFKRRVEKTVDLTKFVEKVDQVIVYVKMIDSRAKISNSIVFNWLAMINDDSNYEPYHVEQEVLRNFEDTSPFGEIDMEYVLKELYEIHKIFEEIVNEFDDKKDYTISLHFDEETRRADLSIYKNDYSPIDFSLFDDVGHFRGGR